MKRIFVLIFFLLVSFQVVADEVGSSTFVVEPKADPLFTSEGGSRYWPCAGMVNAKLIKIIFSEMTTLSRSEKISLPSEPLCLYSIGSFSFGGQTVPIFQVNYYVNQASMEQCLYKDSCMDFRTMMFKISDGKLHRQYMVTSAQKKLTRMVCVEMSGKLVSATAGCP
ncbi:MAG: hypothetical protein RI928_574 [Pseudomonadota bacterium]